MLPSRKQRREMARKFGLVKRDISYKEWTQQLERSIRAGQAIHQAHLQENHNRQLKASKKEDQSQSTDLEWSDIVKPDSNDSE